MSVTHFSVKSIRLKPIGSYSQNFTAAVPLTFAVSVTPMLEDIGLTAHCAEPA